MTVDLASVADKTFDYVIVGGGVSLSLHVRVCVTFKLTLV